MSKLQEIQKYAEGLEADSQVLNWLEKNIKEEFDQSRMENL